jgi:uncharacterized membrane protein
MGRHKLAGCEFPQRWKLVVPCLIVTIGLAAFYFNGERGFPCTAIRSSERLINLPLTALRPGTANTFCYRDAAGEIIRFIVARDADGTIHSAFDACHSCFEYHQGYQLSGKEMVCRFCGNRYRIEDMCKGVASCIPIRLPHLLVSNVVRIKVADLEAGRRLFRNRLE